MVTGFQLAPPSAVHHMGPDSPGEAMAQPSDGVRNFRVRGLPDESFIVTAGVNVRHCHPASSVFIITVPSVNSQ
jgi:hypothetical protein